MKSKIMAGVLMFIIISVLLTGCGGKQKEIPYPDGYYVPKKEETETAGKFDKSQKNASETAKETTRETIQARAGSETENKKISFYLDTSGSMQRSPEVVKIHAAATKCAAGYEERHFYSVDSRNLIETTEQLALSGQYGSGAAIDLIRDGTLPCDPEGVNVLTTDLQTGTSCSEIGKWLVNTGATGYSFYVFTMQYNGSLQFKMYTSSSVLETVSVKDCSFTQKEFLMIVFGKNSLVEDYDQFFQYKLGTEVPYDTCHVSLHAEKKQDDHFLQLTSSKCFEADIANIIYDNNNYVFGMSLVDTENTEFTCPNTFVYKKSKYSTSKATKGNGCVVLMSDGRQYYLKNGQRGSEAQETKLDNGAEIYKSESLEAALKDFKEKKWPVYTLEMSADIKDYYDEAGLHTPKEWKGNGGFKIPTGRFYMQHIADETGGEKFTAFTQLEVQNNFAGIFNKFYEGTEAGGILVNSEIKSGKANMDFDVAEMIAETNITITGNDMSKVNSIELTDPSGSTKKYTETNKTGITLKAGNNFNKSVTITGLEKAATVTFAGREYDTAAGKTLKKAKISRGQYIDIYVDGINITLTRMN